MRVARRSAQAQASAAGGSRRAWAVAERSRKAALSRRRAAGLFNPAAPPLQSGALTSFPLACQARTMTAVAVQCK